MGKAGMKFAKEIGNDSWCNFASDIDRHPLEVNHLSKQTVTTPNLLSDSFPIFGDFAFP
jgi:hypothetical protein